MTDLIVSTVCGAIALAIGLACGEYSGHMEACKSVQAEWVKDKCMKVIREEIK